MRSLCTYCCYAHRKQSVCLWYKRIAKRITFEVYFINCFYLELLYCLWRTSRDCGEVANRLENILYAKLWEEGNICEESFIAKHERDIEKVSLDCCSLPLMPEIRDPLRNFLSV